MRRVEQEWHLLGLLAAANHTRVSAIQRVDEDGDQAFRVTLHHTCGLIAQPSSSLLMVDTHDASFIFRRFFPSVPIEARLHRPVFHPNVHRDTGFVCLWHHFSSADTVLDAVRRLQRVITWELMNPNPDHVMQLDALEWSVERSGDMSLPLRCDPVTLPAGFDSERSYTSRPPFGYRPRLTAHQ